MANVDWSRFATDTGRSERPDVQARRHAVTSGHYLASQAGFQILEAGGNAFDAGVAVGIALGVVESEFVGFAGVAPSLMYLARTGEVMGLSGVGPWPRATSIDFFQKERAGKIDGIFSTVVPGAPDTWLTVLEKFGTMSFAEVAAPSIGFASQGFPMYPFMAEMIKGWIGSYQRWPSNAAIYLPKGRVPDVGDIFVQKDLGRTMQYMADEEKAQRRKDRKAGIEAARRAFYRGDIAQMILRFHKKMGGFLRAEDLASFRMTVEKPCHIRYRGIDVYSGGPYSQGPSMLQALKILEGYDVEAMGRNSPDYVHVLTEAIKIVAADRDAYIADPRVVDVPIDELLSEGYADQRRDTIAMDRASPDVPLPGAIKSRTAGKPIRSRAHGRDLRGPEGIGAYADTSYFCVVDQDGNMFSSTPSDGHSQGPVVPGTGVVVSTRGLCSWADPKHLNSIAPGKRPRLTNGPGFATKKGKWMMPLGTPGTDVQLQAMIQTLFNVVHFGMTPQGAIEAARFASYSFPSSFEPHAKHPGRLNLEAGVGKETGDELARRGHKVEWWGKRSWLAGSMCAIRKDLKTGVMQAAADPRRTAYAIGW